MGVGPEAPPPGELAGVVERRPADHEVAAVVGQFPEPPSGGEDLFFRPLGHEIVTSSLAHDADEEGDLAPRRVEGE